MVLPELRAQRDALFGQKPIAIFPPRTHPLRGLRDHLDDLGLRLGLGQQLRQSALAERIPPRHLGDEGFDLGS